MQQDIINKNTKAEFYICAKRLDFDEITGLLDIMPTSIRPYQTFLIEEFAEDYWCIETEYEYSEDINIQLEKITNKIVDKQDKINFICKKYNAMCGFNVIIKTDNEILPAIYFEREFVTMAAGINSQIQVDIV